MDTEYKVENKHWSVHLTPEEKSPVIISVPHDCLTTSQMSVIRQVRPDGIRTRDIHTWSIAKHIATIVPINTVRQLMCRTILDCNRGVPNDPKMKDQEIGLAYTDPRVADVYKYYHWVLMSMLRESLVEFGKENTLLIDLHGFTKQPEYAPEGGYDLILGTANRSTIYHDNVDVQLYELMTESGYKVFLPKETPHTDKPDKCDGGHTVRFYSERLGINAIQIEVSRKFRRKGESSELLKLAEVLALFVGNF